MNFEASASGTQKREAVPAPDRVEHVRQNEHGYGISLDGEHFVQTPPRIARLIRLALKVQDRLDTDPLSLNREYSTVTDLVEGINCHKTALFARGDITTDQLLHTGIEAEVSGHPEVISLANEHPDNLMFFSGDVREFAQNHAQDFPFTVHILVQKNATFHPAHSLLWLGVDETGKELVFHKAGPYLDMPFELTTLDAALDPYDDLASVFLVLPVTTRE